MSRLSYPLKFLLISTLFILPLAVVMYLLITETDEKIQFTKMEKRGTRYLRTLRALMQDLPEARLRDYQASEDASQKNAAQTVQQKINSDFTALKKLNNEHGKALNTVEKSNALMNDWLDFEQNGAALTPMERDKRYIRLILSLKSLITHAGNTSHLILEPDLDTYYLMNALLLKSPENQDTLGQLRIISQYVLAKKGVSAQGRAEFFRLSNITENNLYEMQKGMQFVRRAELEKLLQEQNDAVVLFLRTFHEKIIRSENITATKPEMDALCSDALDKSFKLWDRSIVEMDKKLNGRIFQFQAKKNLTRLFYVLVLLCVFYFWMGFYKSVMNTVSELEAAEKRMVSGDFDSPADLDAKDELGRIVHSFNNIARRLRAERDQATAAEQELRRTQLQLIQAAKLESVGRLSAGIAHEVKNPLAVLLQGIDFLNMQPEMKKDHYPAILADMKNAVERADNVIKGLLDFSAPKELSVKSENLNEIIEESLLFVRHEMAKTNVQLVKSLSPAVSGVLLDKNKMQQVFINLFTNACHAMPGGGTLSVRTSVQANGKAPDALIVIEDTGTGIPEDKLSRVFDPFFTTKPTGKGTGLGLSVVRSIVEMHKGNIELGNKKSGGVRIAITLPLNGSLIMKEAK